MLKVGLTGGIGCGKSTVCALFADLGIPIIDADIVARQLVEPGQAALQKIVENFGDSLLLEDGRLNRSALRQRIFGSPVEKQQLESILHPLIYAEIEAQIDRLESDYCVLAIPLLLETQHKYQVDRILVVDCSTDRQIQRVITRDNVDENQVAAIIASQASRQQRLAAADDVIDNSGAVQQLAEQVKTLHNSYLLLATARKFSA